MIISIKSFRRTLRIALTLLLPICAITFCCTPAHAQPQPATTPTVFLKTGQLTTVEIPQGKFICYHPQGIPRDVLVVIHGTPDPNIPVVDHARNYIGRWLQLADYRQMIIIAPVFDENYGAGNKIRGVPGDGYRGLYGKFYSADYFVNSAVNSISSFIPNYDEKFILYGHSAGGQFVSRYLACHPQRVRFAIMSAAGRYAYPDPAATWPYGMAKTEIDLNGRRILLSPDPRKWLLASMTPVAVIVGDLDTEPQPARPGHVGITRIDLAKSYTESMKKLAASNGQKSPWQIHIQPGAGHSSARLTPLAQRLIGDFYQDRFR